MSTPALNAPKEIVANLKFRNAMISWGSQSKDHAEQLWIRCRRDPIFYVDTFVYTFNPKKGHGLKKLPFILWPYQEDAFLQILEGIESGNDKLIEKSRDMGASWLILMAYEYLWHFYDDMSFLLLSRKEDLVDKKDDLDALMPKIDFILEHEPGWLLPVMFRKHLHLHNIDNGSKINGESTNSDAARGGRRTSILLDEFASVSDGFDLLSATFAVTDCRIFNSTPKGASGAFHDRVEVIPKEHKIRMHWSQHPEKGKDQYVDENGKLRSPWYDRECARIANPTEVAQEIDIDYTASDYMFFDSGILEKLLKDTAMTPIHRGEMVYDNYAIDRGEYEGADISFSQDTRGGLRIWQRLDYRNQVPPPRKYVAGADISAGTGSSNSVLSICDVVSREKVAEYAVSNLGPHEFAKVCVVICHWYHLARLCWEVNGPGLTFGREVKKLSYGNVYFRENVASRFQTGRVNKDGWHSSKESKRVLLSDYRTHLGKGLFINHSKEALEECKKYVEMGSGSIEHSGSQHSKDPTGALENHGDRVIADALASMLMNRYASQSSRTAVDPVIRAGSIAHRMRQVQRELVSASKEGW